MQRGGDVRDGAHWNVQSHLDDRAKHGRVGRQDRPRPNAIQEVGTVRRNDCLRYHLRHSRVIMAGSA